MYGTPSLHAIKYVIDKKHVVGNKASLCVVLLVRAYFEVYCLHKRTNHVNLSKLVKYHPLGPGDAATRNAAVWLFLRQ